MSHEPVVKILELLAEGGSLTVLGRKTGQDWEYALEVDESALAEEGGGRREMSCRT